MSRLQLRLQLLALEPTPAEEEFRSRMVALLEAVPDCFQRHCFPAHFTASALVVSADGSRALLNHHRNLNRWMQFGGHCDGDDNLVRVAAREALEESGIEGLIVASAKPFDLDIHQIPENARRGEPAHFHFDVRYVLIAPQDAQFTVSAESHALEWFTPAEMQEMDLDAGMRRLVAKWQALLKRRSHTDLPIPPQ